MKAAEREEFIMKFFDEQCFTKLREKGKEYNINGDVNGNFKKIAALTTVDAKMVWLVHFSKHLDSIINYIKEGRVSCDEPIEGRIADAVNYLLILASMIEEERKDHIAYSKAGTTTFRNKEVEQ